MVVSSITAGGGTSPIRSKIPEGYLGERDDNRGTPEDWNWARGLFETDDTVELSVIGYNRGGLLVEALREPKIPDDAIVLQRSRRWQRLPLFLHLRARRP